MTNNKDKKTQNIPDDLNKLTAAGRYYFVKTGKSNFPEGVKEGTDIGSSKS